MNLSAHDHFFRSMLTNPKVINDFFNEHLPNDIKAVINFASINPQKDSFIDDKLRLQISDLLYSVEFNHQPGYLYLLLEHQSHPDKLMAFRLLKYVIAIMDQHLKKTNTQKLPLVYPLVFYSGYKKHNYSTDLFDLFGREKELAQNTLWKPYHLIELNKIPDENLKKYLWSGVFARIMKHIYEKDVLPFLRDLIQDLSCIEKQGDLEYIYSIISYLFQAAEPFDQKEFIHVVTTGLTEVDEAKIMTMGDYLRQEGKKEGILEGMLKGKQEGKLEGIYEGLLKGQVEASKTIAKELLNCMSVTDVARITKLPIAEVEALLTEKSH